ncbi:unnamed protein product [Cyclocybe aegerita]|uniref:Uncharacterized protein n=1 Tax=Cyclocybe aegerita TaxID=1973307 RepID=A0A8S0XZU0_CYCAE|nr:unnamed protein product [Cyclocybe aegerita]
MPVDVISTPVSHPELELRLLELTVDNPTGLKEDTSHESIFIDVVEIYPERSRTKRGLRPGGLASYFPQSAELNSGRGVDAGPTLLRIIFVEDPAYADSSLPPLNRGRPSLNKTALWLHHRFGVSLSFYQNMSPTLELRATGCGYFTKYDQAEKAIALIGFYQNSHGFDGGPVHIWFSHSLQEPRSSTYVIYNTPPGAKKHIFMCAEKQDSSLLLRPLAVDAFMEEDYHDAWHLKTGCWRTKLVYFEDDSRISTFTPAQCVKAVEELHDIDKNLHVAHGNFQDLLEKLDFLLSIREKYLTYAAHLSPPAHFSQRDITSIDESLSLLRLRGQFGLRWTRNYYERARIRINLFFNLTTQADSRTNLDIARLTTKISVTAQRDSSSMITIAAVTMFFLPGSFVSTLFSMVFFDAETNQRGKMNLSVSSQWWLFPLVAIPLTILVFVIWIVWQRQRQARVLKEVEEVQQMTPRLEDVERSSIFSEKKIH